MFIASADNRAGGLARAASPPPTAHALGLRDGRRGARVRLRRAAALVPDAIARHRDRRGGGFPKPSYALASRRQRPARPRRPRDGLRRVLRAHRHEQRRCRRRAARDRVCSTAIRSPRDDQLADGEASLHDRALAIMRVAIIDLDRLHTDPATGLLVDSVTLDRRHPGARPHAVHDVARVHADRPAHGAALARRSARAVLEQHAGHRDQPHAARCGAAPLPRRCRAHVLAARRADAARARRAALRPPHRRDAGARGRGWDVAANAPIDDSDTLDAHAAAVRGLFAAYLATGDIRYRDRARGGVRSHGGGVLRPRRADLHGRRPRPSTSVEYTPLRFALVQSTLRDMYELIARRPGGEARDRGARGSHRATRQARARWLGRSRSRTGSSTSPTSA